MGWRDLRYGGTAACGQFAGNSPTAISAAVGRARGRVILHRGFCAVQHVAELKGLSEQGHPARHHVGTLCWPDGH